MIVEKQHLMPRQPRRGGMIVEGGMIVDGGMIVGVVSINILNQCLRYSRAQEELYTPAKITRTTGMAPTRPASRVILKKFQRAPSIMY